MRPGYALYIHRSAHFSARSAVTTTAEITQLIVGKTSAVIAAIFFAVVIAAQAQESVEDGALPAWTEPTLPSSEPAPQATEPAPVPSTSESLPSSPAEPIPSSSEPLPSSEEAFPSSPDPWSSSGNYTTAQTSVVGTPNSGGPYGEFSTKNIALGEGPPSSEPRRFYYGLQFTVRGVWDDNIFLSHTNKTSDYYFAIEPQLTLGLGRVSGPSLSIKKRIGLCATSYSPHCFCRPWCSYGSPRLKRLVSRAELS